MICFRSKTYRAVTDALAGYPHAAFSRLFLPITTATSAAHREALPPITGFGNFRTHESQEKQKNFLNN